MVTCSECGRHAPVPRKGWAKVRVSIATFSLLTRPTAEESTTDLLCPSCAYRAKALMRGEPKPSGKETAQA